MDNILHAVSLGCAPTPIQYLALTTSSLMSLCSWPVLLYGSSFGTGSYVPMTSMGLLFLADLEYSHPIIPGTLLVPGVFLEVMKRCSLAKEGREGKAG
jgi:hypothetical protein